MDTTPIIQFIDAEIARLEQAKALLNGHATPAKRGRPIGSNATPQTAKPRRGRMSPKGRARIVAAQKARWAKIKRGWNWSGGSSQFFDFCHSLIGQGWKVHSDLLSLDEQQDHLAKLQKFCVVDMLSFNHHLPPNRIVLRPFDLLQGLWRREYREKRGKASGVVAISKDCVRNQTLTRIWRIDTAITNERYYEKR